MDAKLGATFAKNVRKGLDEKGWNQSTLAKRAAVFMPNRKLERQSISDILAKERIPSQPMFAAIAKALGREPYELLDMKSSEWNSTHVFADMPLRTPPPSVDAGDVVSINVSTKTGRAHIKIDTDVSFDVALKVMALLNDDKAN